MGGRRTYNQGSAGNTRCVVERMRHELYGTVHKMVVRQPELNW